MAQSAPETIRWEGGLGGELRLLDQTRLPLEVRVLNLNDLEGVRDAILRLAVRGAPSIGVAAAYGLVLGLRAGAGEGAAFDAALTAAAERLASARPTAVNLFWAIERMRTRAEKERARGAAAPVEALFEEARAIQAEDEAMSLAMARAGAALIEDGDAVLTHCNTGPLAAGGLGTALGCVIEAHRQGKRVEVYADETRPLLQGARLTTWELMQHGVPVTLICDNTAAQAMRTGRVRKVFVGSDRIAANGDVANKIGTYGVALLARAHGLPFHVVAPSSTVDLDCPGGEAIPIEERAPEEVTEGFGRRTAPEGCRVWSPAFDVTPAELVSAIITERGVMRPPYPEALAAWRTPPQQGESGASIAG